MSAETTPPRQDVQQSHLDDPNTTRPSKIWSDIVEEEEAKENSSPQKAIDMSIQTAEKLNPGQTEAVLDASPCETVKPSEITPCTTHDEGQSTSPSPSGDSSDPEPENEVFQDSCEDSLNLTKAGENQSKRQRDSPDTSSELPPTKAASHTDAQVKTQCPNCKKEVGMKRNQSEFHCFFCNTDFYIKNPCCSENHVIFVPEHEKPGEGECPLCKKKVVVTECCRAIVRKTKAKYRKTCPRFHNPWKGKKK